MNKLKRFLALFLTMCLMLSCVPFGAMATEPTGTTSTETTAATENATESTTAPVETQTPVETTMPSTEAPVETTVPSTETPVETTVPATEAPVETTVPATETPEETTVPTEPEFERTAVAYASLRTSYADFYRVFHMDVGRKYFTVDQVKEIIDVLAASGYSHIELAIGNDALRLILDDMSVTVGDTTYTHDQIASGIKAGNVNYSHSGEWTQAEMDTIIAYANGKGIEIIPLVNTPGHMDAILDAMESVGINGAFTTDYYGTSARTVDVTNDEAVAFTQALVNKYIQYFAAKGSTVFHMGADEYANDILVNYTGMGFGYLQNKGYYDEYATYINEMASLIKTAGMIPAAFNDGLYYGSSTSASFDSDILVTYWSSGWTSYEVASASFLANQGHKILNTNDGWYYVLGRATGGYSYESASTNVASTPVTDVPGSGDPDVVGAMICLWCDTPSADYDSNKDKVVYLLETLAENNADYFVVETEVPETTEPEPTESEPTVPETSEPATTEPETDEVVQGDVTISADGVTSAVVEELEGFANKPEDVKAYVGYSIVLNDGEYTGAATVKVPYDAALFPGCDTYALIVDGDTFYGNNEAGEPYVAIEGEYFILNVPHFSDVYVVGYSTPVEVSVSVGGTTTVTIEGSDVTGTLDTSNLDTNTANVTAKYEVVEGSTETTLGSQITPGSTNGWSDTGVIKSGDNYLVMSDAGALSVTTDVKEATVFTITGTGYSQYSIKYGSYYLRYSSRGMSGSVSGSTTSYSWYYSSSNGFYRSSGGGGARYLTYSNNSWTTAQSVTNRTFVYDVVTTTTDPVDQTTITFTGVAVGTTSVMVNGTTYNITVTDAPPSNAMTSSTLTVEQWITNIHAGTESANGDWDFTINSSDANTEAGVEIATLAPATAYWAHSDLYYWQSVRLDSANEQTTDRGDDETMDGTPFTHVRYYNGAWQYKTADGVWHYFLESDQVVAYYLQKIDVTDEVDTYFKDWGYDPGVGDSGENQVALSVAVVYPDGTVSPAEEDIYLNSTTMFNYWENRNIGLVAPLNNSDYDIAKITVTAGTRVNNSNSTDTWGTSDDIEWEKVTNEAGSGWYDETTYWDAETNAGTTPMVNGAVSNIVWPSGDTAYLVLIYLETKVTEDSLIVNWVDDSANGALIHTMPVNVTITGDETKTFNSELKQTSAVPTLGDTSSFTLDDDAYVFNSSEVNQTFNKDISIIPDVAAQYRSGLYKYVSADISADGKTLTLHYNIDTAKLSPLYVVDFGLPVEFSVSELVDNPNEVSNIKIYPTSNYGTAELIAAESGSVIDATVRYTPNAVLENVDVLKFDVTFTNGNTQTFRMGFVPASTVYYEEGFVQTWTGEWTDMGSKSTNKQETQVAYFTADDGKVNTGNDTPNYGYTSVFANTINSDYASSETNGDKAQFSFSGTGIDIYANCDTDTSIVSVLLYKDGTLQKLYQVDTANASGTTSATDNQTQDGTIGLPIVSIHDLPYGSYDVIIQHTTGTAGKAFKLDGFRVYNTLGTTESAHAYYTVSERYATFVELRESTLAAYNIDTSIEYTGDSIKTVTDQIYADHGTEAGAIVLSTDLSTEQAEDLLVNGPKNELYLWPDETVTFALIDGLTAQIGMKAITGATTAKVNDIAITVSSTVDMFYDANTSADVSTNFSGTIEIKNDGNNVLSITKLKVFGASSENVFAAVSAGQVEYSLRRMVTMSEPEVEDTTPTEPEEITPTEPETPVEPEVPEVVYADASVSVNVVDYAGNSVATTALTVNGVAGEACTFTAADILDAVKAVLPAGYAVADETSVSDLEMTYGSVASTTVKVGKVATLNITYKRLFGRSTETVTLTVVQTSAASGYTFTAREIRGAIPAARIAVWMRNVRVNFGSAKNIFVPIF